MGISVKLLDDNSKIYVEYSLGVGEPEFQMLNHLSQYNSVESANELIQELTKVTNKSQEFWGWGTDFCLITSYAEKSVIEHHINPDNGDWALDPIYQIEIPTLWLLQLFKDWKLFLELNPKEKYIS